MKNFVTLRTNLSSQDFCLPSPLVARLWHRAQAAQVPDVNELLKKVVRNQARLRRADREVNWRVWSKMTTS